MYLIFSLVMFMVGGFMALILRAELFVPGLQLVDPHFFNQMTTLHALGNGIWRRYARHGRFCQLASPINDWCSGYGAAAFE